MFEAAAQRAAEAAPTQTQPTAVAPAPAPAAQIAPAPAEAPAPPVAPEAAAEAARVSETLPVALEPELRRIIDTAVARVASIELQAIRESRQLTQRTEEESREALKFALERTQQLVDGFELLTTTVAGMISSLRIELESAMKALDTADDPYAHLTIDQQPKGAAEPALSAAPAEQKAAPAPPPQEQAGAAPKAEPATQGMNGDGPDVHTEPSPEIAEMFREQIINMKNSGKTREEAERTLLRFNLGRRFLGLLDEVYDDDSTAEPAPEGEHRGRFVRRFFSRQ